jgi:alcohol dehydrogenase class IV
MTPIWGITEDGVKKTGRDRKVMPKSVIYDVNLTLSLPPHIAAPSGMNALAHCVEALYAEDGNPIVSLLAEEGIRALGRSLPIVVKEPENVGARSDAQYGAWLGGTVLGAVGMSIHHKLCHTLGGSFNLPHAETHTVVLPHALAYNAAAAPQAMAAIARAMGVGDVADPLAAARAIHAFTSRLGAPTALRAIGMPADGLDRAADLFTTGPELCAQTAINSPPPPRTPLFPFHHATANLRSLRTDARFPLALVTAMRSCHPIRICYQPVNPTRNTYLRSPKCQRIHPLARP